MDNIRELENLEILETTIVGTYKEKDYVFPQTLKQIDIKLEDVSNY